MGKEKKDLPRGKGASAGEIRQRLEEAEKQYALLLKEEPEEDSEAFAAWMERLEEMDDRMDEWREMLDDAEEE